ncbi:hypothetical protein AJ80_06886 [Polytolypa hystricis UAMH7299]|uniref:Malate dehydrogenase n=1 Tax=Polytolypa hystricis (strain UAMH7299) TaxID=1447883 RepID=A0A2B7XUA6_POLH7|nr:hypothetical protein AJ80_06886 [Polytolypa hystricis UAMH7299]
MRPILLIAASMASMALAAPSGWSAEKAKFYSAVSKLISKRDSHDGPSCDLSKAVLPVTYDPLAEVPEGQKLLHVGVGRGTQNYTCSSPSAKEEPKAQGALATIFEASCIAANYPFLLSLLPNIALESTNPPRTAEGFGPTDMSVLGFHYFSDGTTAVFDLKGSGASSVAKDSAVDAPLTAIKGVGTELEGAVPWLLLKSVESSTGQVKSIYRTNTAGGSPPKNCAGQPEVIPIQYAAEYWFYG